MWKKVGTIVLKLSCRTNISPSYKYISTIALILHQYMLSIYTCFSCNGEISLCNKNRSINYNRPSLLW